ncbi:MAG: mechanosensitive ion channel family protein [Candidatus Nanoarchaeia archaeon]
MIELPPFLLVEYFGTPLFHYILFFLALFGSYLVGKCVSLVVARHVKKLTKKTKTKIDDVILDSFERPLLLFALLLGGYGVLTALQFHPSVMVIANRVFDIGLVIAIGWFMMRFVDSCVLEYLIPLAKKSKSELDDQLVPVVRRGTKVLIWALVVVMVLDNLGVNVGALIAGLGIGGLAVAFASKDTIENLISGILIFIDKPFKLKDWVEVAGQSGIVEEVGIRSTRIRTWDNTLVIVPNKSIIGQEIENYQERSKAKVSINIGLVYGTSAAKMQKAKTILNKILDKYKAVGKTDRRILFESFGDFSLNIQFIYWVHDKKKFFEIKDKINLDILHEFEKAKLEMAFPTQTIEVKKVK